MWLRWCLENLQVKASVRGELGGDVPAVDCLDVLGRGPSNAAERLVVERRERDANCAFLEDAA